MQLANFCGKVGGEGEKEHDTKKCNGRLGVMIIRVDESRFWKKVYESRQATVPIAGDGFKKMRPTALQRKYWIAVTGLCFFTLILAFVKIAPEDGGDATGKIILSLFFAPVVFIALFVNLHSVSYNEEKLAYCNFLLKKKELYFKDIIDHHTHSLGYKLQLRTNESSYFLSNKLDGFVEFIRFLIDENYIRCSKYEFLELAAISGK